MIQRIFENLKLYVESENYRDTHPISGLYHTCDNRILLNEAVSQRSSGHGANEDKSDANWRKQSTSPSGI